MAHQATLKEIEEYFEVAKKLALEAGEVFKSALTLEKDSKSKALDQDRVTEYDKIIEKILTEGLSSKFPNHKIIAEETSNDAGVIAELTDSPTWIIDPIDGTTNFIHGFPECCISIGLTILKRLELGLIYNPCCDEMYTAIRGQGAFLNGKPLKTSKITELKKSLICLEPLTILPIGKDRDIALARLDTLICSTQGTRCIGSAALGLAYIARGTLDAFQLDYISPWDIAAGRIIVEEAGGTLIDTKGGPHNIMKPKTIAASTEILAKTISKLIIETDLQTQRKRLKRIPSSSKLL